VNQHAADAGDVVKHLLLAEVLHLEHRRIATYVDTHAGRPWNDVTRSEYEFSRKRQDEPAWADRFMESATSGALGRELSKARYTELLQQDCGAGAFWGPSGLSSRPVYPGSVGIARSSRAKISSWLCGERNDADRRMPRAALPPGSAYKTLFSIGEQAWREKLRRSLGPEACVLVDPFHLAARNGGPDWPDGLHARRFAVQAARQGALVLAWYSLHGPKTAATIENEVWAELNSPPLEPLNRLKVEVRWSQSQGQQMTGAGVVIANLTGKRTAERLELISRALEPLYGSVSIDRA
jgi:23S rRNA A2030 N6-methylase RlmJ